VVVVFSPDGISRGSSEKPLLIICTSEYKSFHKLEKEPVGKQHKPETGGKTTFSFSGSIPLNGFMMKNTM